MVKNEDKELIPTRITTGWRVCIDYRRLNKVTRKDHFPLPFIDQMMDRLTGHSYYCLLDGYNGYNQIATRRPRQNHLHMSLWHICLQKDAIWIMQCTSHLLEMHDEHFLRHGREIH